MKVIIVMGMLVWLPSASSAQAAVACGGTLHEESGRQLLFVDEASSSCPWAFTTDKMVLACEGASLIAVTEDGRKWALNGTAGSKLKLPSIRPIWKDRADLPGAKVNISPWIEAGRSVCK